MLPITLYIEVDGVRREIVPTFMAEPFVVTGSGAPAKVWSEPGAYMSELVNHWPGQFTNEGLTTILPGDRTVNFNWSEANTRLQQRIDYRVTPPQANVSPPLGIVGNRATIENKKIQTVRGGNKGAEIVGDDVTLRNVSFTDDGGYLIKANGAKLLIDGMTAGSFFDYAVYLEGTRNATLRNITVKGGSTNESVLRLAGVDGVLIENADIDYTATPRKATLRGWGRNIVVRNCKFNGRNSTIGLTPMSYDDGGSGFIAGGYLYINRAPYLVTVDNKADWMAAVRVSIASGKLQHADILADVLNRVPVRVKINGTVVTIPVGEVDQAKTVAERIKNVGQRAEATFDNCTIIDAPIRNSAGGNQRYTGCTFIYNEGVEPFTGWNENVYPPDNLLLPRDEKRPFPVTVFENCRFQVASWDGARFTKFVKDNGIQLVGCEFNGKALANVGQA